MDFEEQRKALGEYIRSQRKLANLSLRQMAALADISNPYLSQIERGLHQPSVQVLRSLAHALDLSAETLLAHAGLLADEEGADRPNTEHAIKSDPRLNAQQKTALLAVYRSYCEANEASTPGHAAGAATSAGASPA
jgi:transcriptional regulator with XRE-family HTH domain